MEQSSKHQNQSVTTLQNFAGGLNTSVPPEFIDATQLADIVNFEINKGGQLRTVLGTRDLAVMADYGMECNIKAATYDVINNKLLLFCTDRCVYSYDATGLKNIGTLSGKDEIISVCWEDGVLIASGGYLQYAKYGDVGKNGVEDKQYSLFTIGTSPTDCGGVYVRSGRVLVFDSQDNLLYSAVGDEESWEQDSNDPSTAVFTQIGYKVGGKILGLVSLQSYVLVLKDNGKIYRLENEYPDWVIKEVTSNGLCKGKAAYASVGSNIFILGETTLQSINPVDDSGNMPINYVGKQIENQIASLPPKTKMRFIADLNQLWFITNSQWVLVYDCNTQTFFQRYFNSDVVDVVGNFIIKRNKVCELSMMESVMQDDGLPLSYKVVFKTEMGTKDILVKHIDLSINPLVSYYDNFIGNTEYNAQLKVDRIKVMFPNRTKSAVNKRIVGVTNVAGEKDSTELAESASSPDLFLNDENLSVGKSILYKKRQICRCQSVGVSITGNGFPFVLNYISYDKVVM